MTSKKAMPRRKVTAISAQASSRGPKVDAPKADNSASTTMGRPRSVESEQAILAAAWCLLQHNNASKISIEAIAREAGVGKTTIYRWWPNKTAILVDAFLAQIEPSILFPKAETATEALVLQMKSVVRALSSDAGRIVAEIIAEGQRDSDALDSFRDRFLNIRRDAARQIILQGIEAGEFDPNLNTDVAMDILYGPIYYRLLVRHLPLDEAFSTQLSHLVIPCLAASSNSPQKL